MKSKWLKIFLIILIPLFLGLFSFRLLLYDDGFYEAEFEKNGVYEEFGEEYVSEYQSELFDFFRGEGELSDELFNAKEQEHLKDVKEIFYFMDWVYYSVFVIFILGLGWFVFHGRRKRAGEVFFYGGILGLCGVVIFLLVGLISFDFLFKLIHEVLFRNDLWLMDPSVDKMVLVFPFQFFFDFFVKLLVYFSGFSWVSVFLGWWFKR